jgi:putative ABC transport system permease protein
MLLKRPGFLAVAVLTLALGAGANTAMFSVVNTVLLSPLPYPDDGRIVRIVQNRPGASTPGGFPSRLPALSTDDLLEWRARSQTFAQMAAYGPAGLTMTGGEEPVRLVAARVSPAVFPLLGIAPLKGRTFDATEEKAGADAVVVLSFTAWQKYFAADPDILTRTLRLDDRGYTVVGVMPRGFEFPDSQTEVWTPFVLSAPVQTPGARMIQLVQVIARVKPGVSIATATAESNAIFQQLRPADAKMPPDLGRGASPAPGDGREAGGRRAAGPNDQFFGRGAAPPAEGNQIAGRRGPGPGEDAPIVRRRGTGPDGETVLGRGPVGGPAAGPGRGAPISMAVAMPPATIELSPIKEELVRPVRPALVVLVASVGFVLLIACANVANLLLARAAGRRQEVAVRAALGAARGRLVRQMLTESLVLALMGSAIGTLLAWGAIQAVRVLGPADIPRLAQLHVDTPFFAFTLGVAVLAGVLFGLMPAIRLSSTSEMQAIKQGAAFPSSGLRLFGPNGIRSVLAMTEIALAMMLLVGAGLLVNSFLKLTAVNPGYDPTNVLAFQVPLPDARYTPQARDAFYGQMLERLRALPGVRAAAVSNSLPLQQGIIRIGVTMLGQPAPTRPEDFTTADARIVSPEYLATMGIRLIDGRNLIAEDRADRPQELLVNQTFVRRYLAGERAIGKRLNLSMDQPWEIVGVVNDVRFAGLTADPLPELYVDYRQSTTVLARGMNRGFFTVRTTGSPTPLVPAIRAAVRQLDPQLVADNVATMEARLSDSVASPRFYATLVGVFAFIAVALAAVGIYGVLAYTVSQCTREIGIRLALGAPQGSVLGLVLKQGCVIAAIGMSVGLGGAEVAARSLTTLLFGVTPSDPATFVGVSALLAVIAVTACYVPARRAMRVDPIVALRQD